MKGRREPTSHVAMDDKMMRQTANIFWVSLIFGALLGARVAAAADTTQPTDELFLIEAAAAQKAEMALGQIATERAEYRHVKQFGLRMMEDHQKAGREVRQLASQTGIELPAGLPTVHTDKAQHIAELSGIEFDRTYITYMLKDHLKSVMEFEHSARELNSPDVQQWASTTLPILKEHLQLAKTIAHELGIDLATAQQ
jgi:putative membrane protein